MNKKEAWNKFKESGKVTDYLRYAKKRSEENDNQSRGNNN